MPGRERDTFRGPAHRGSPRARAADQAIRMRIHGPQRRRNTTRSRVGSVRPGDHLLLGRPTTVSTMRRPGRPRRGRRTRRRQPPIEGNQPRFTIERGLGQTYDTREIPHLLKRLANKLRNDGWQAEFLAAINGGELDDEDRQLLGGLCSAYPTALQIPEGTVMSEMEGTNSEVLPIAHSVEPDDGMIELPLAVPVGGKKTKRRRKKKTRKKKTKRRKKKTKRKKRHLKKRTRKRRR